MVSKTARTTLLAAFALLACCLAWSGVARAEPVDHRTSFDILFGLLPVGKATFDIRVTDTAYRLNANGRTMGLVDLFSPGSGRTRSTGRIVGDRVVADTNDIFYTEKKKRTKFRMEFEDGNVKSVSYKPDRRKKKIGPAWVPIKPEQLKSVIDPASTMVVPVAPDKVTDPHAVCDRVLNVYDGDTRFDAALKYKATKTISTKGYEGPAFVCQLRYIPVSGHKKKQRNIEYMSANEGIEIWLAPIEGTSVFTAIRIEVPTWVGTVTAIPTHFGPVTRSAAAPANGATKVVAKR